MLKSLAGSTSCREARSWRVYHTPEPLDVFRGTYCGARENVTLWCSVAQGLSTGEWNRCVSELKIHQTTMCRSQ